MQSGDFTQFESRKSEHLALALESSAQSEGSGFDRIELFHDSLCELDFEQVNLASKRLGQAATKPFFISGMTGGAHASEQINTTLASACAEMQWALGVGSQRRELESGEADRTWTSIRAAHPQIELFANIGASQLVGMNPLKIFKLAESLQASALVVHLNPLQEVMQPEGTPKFRGVVAALKNLVPQSPVPVVLKETGSGFSKQALDKIRDLKLGAIDVSGKGGTHWGRIEGKRAAGKDALRAGASETFKNWGISTLDSVLNVREFGLAEAWGSGGVRSGLDAAKLIALGCPQVGFAKPALEQALLGIDPLLEWMRQIEFELRTALFCTGNSSPMELMKREGAWKRNEN